VEERQARSSFFEKKEPKKLLDLGALAGARPLSPPAGGLKGRAPAKAPKSRSFLLLFFKKEVLPFFLFLGLRLA